MKVNLQIDFDSDRKETVKIMGEQGMIPDAWRDLAICLEAVGCLAGICRVNGIVEHNGMQVDKYLHEYLDKVLHDYESKETWGSMN